jgi:hypothetical protein
VPEAGTHWFGTYINHHKKELKLQQSTFDPCLLYRNDLADYDLTDQNDLADRNSNLTGRNKGEITNKIHAIVGIQTDDTLFIGNKAYQELEEKAIQAAGYTAKPTTTLCPSHPLAFNGGIITMEEGYIMLTQEKHCQRITTINTKKLTQAELKEAFVKERARGAYIASTCQPEASFLLSFAAQSQVNPSIKDAELMNECLAWQIQNKARGLRFIPLDLNKLQMMVFVDASFAGNTDYTSQLGYVIVLANIVTQQNTDGKKCIKIKANIIHWSSTKCKRVTRSVLASELYAMANGFDIASTVKATTDAAVKNSPAGYGRIPLILCTDSYSLYDCIVKLGTSSEKRLMIDIMSLRESYERREIDQVIWINGESNPADSMTKRPAKAGNALRRLVDTNHLELITEAWVERNKEGALERKAQ